MSDGLLLGLLASLGWGVVDVAGALAGHRVGSLRVTAGTGLVSLVVVALVVLAGPARLGADPLAGISAGLPLGLIAGTAYICYFAALKLGPLVVVSPVIVAYGGFTVALAVLLRGETLLPAQVAGTVLATLGVVLAGVVFRSGSRRGARIVGPGVLVAVATVALFAVVTILLQDPIRVHGWLPVVIGSRLANVALVLGLLAVGRAGATALRPLMLPGRPLDRRTAGLLVLCGCGDAGAFVLYAIGLEVAPVWLVGLASSFGPVLAIAYAVARLGERLVATQWAGLAILAAGIALLAVTG